jgi:3-hydroxybutyryl-CoA dehydrogenase
VQIHSAGVVGLGTMGSGIVEVLARSGVDVVAVEINDDLLAAGRRRLEQSLGRALERGRISDADHAAALGRVTFTVTRAHLAVTDLVIDAVPERLDLKSELFTDLDKHCAPSTIFATNTSSLAVTRIAAVTGRPDRVVGMHFFNPAPVMRLVEIVHTVLTAPETVAAVRDLAERCGKTPVVVGDRAGFVANALLFGYLNASARAAETGIAAVADIDAAVVAACGLPMGPLTLMDLIGLDVCLEVLETMFDETRDQRYAAPPLLRRMVVAGQLGRKTGRGYYRYDGDQPVATIDSPHFATGTAAAAGRVRAVTGDAKSGLVVAMGDVAVVGTEEVSDADLVIVDGGSRTASADLVGRVARSARDAVIAVATTDEAPVAALLAHAADPARVVGLHVPLAPRPGVVEVVATLGSSPDAVATVADALRARGLSAVPCRDRPGHLLDMLVLPHLGDAVRMVDEGYATVDDVEAAMTLGCGYPDGPFALLDAVGADDARSRLLHLAAATHLSALAPCPLLDELAATGAAGTVR